ncbi:MAG TPA: Fic family protein [Solirubrobacterales bacterium]|nr:Fic family protein [Solirubrobacterales bacterium]
MPQDDLELLSSAELAAIDASYIEFPSFIGWATEVPRADLWTRDLEAFREISESASEADLERAREIALRTAAFDTGAIEGLYPTDRGLTLTVATQAATWEQEVEERDVGALDLFKAQLNGLDLVLDLVTNRFPKITQAWIRTLHKEIVGAQETYRVKTPVGFQDRPLPKGEYKRHPNHVRTADGALHAYAPVDQTQAEMQRFLTELEGATFRDAHPLLQASYAHYVLTAIHPFADGNGRVARAVASAYTYRAASVPLIVLAHHRDEYLDSLAAADGGNPGPFLEFVARAARDGLEMVTERLRTAQAPQPDQLLGEFRDMYRAQGDLSHRQLDEVGNGFTEGLVEAVAAQVRGLAVPDGVEIVSVGGSGGRQRGLPSGFRSLVVPGPRYVQLELTAAAPGEAKLRIVLDVLVSTETDTTTSVLVLQRDGHEQLMLGLADLVPQLSSAARLRIDSYLQRILGFALSELLARSKARLQEAGY